MVTPREILQFAEKEFACRGACGENEDLFGRFGIAGDDGDEFLEAYAEAFGVDMDGFIGFFHYNGNEPPYFETAWPYSPSGEKLDRIPITANMLAGAANLGKWSYDYPDHVVRGAKIGWLPFILLLAFLVIATALLGFV
jgi:hypothetical protein